MHALADARSRGCTLALSLLLRTAHRSASPSKADTCRVVYFTRGEFDLERFLEVLQRGVELVPPLQSVNSADHSGTQEPSGRADHSGSAESC